MCSAWVFPCHSTTWDRTRPALVVALLAPGELGPPLLGDRDAVPAARAIACSTISAIDSGVGDSAVGGSRTLPHGLEGWQSHLAASGHRRPHGRRLLLRQYSGLSGIK